MRGRSRTRARALAATLLLPCALAGCGARAPAGGAELRPIASVRQVMVAITVPASDGVWGAGAEEPTTDEAWGAIEAQAAALAESGNLLLVPGRARDQGNWRAQALALVEAAERAAAAARARDLDRLLVVGDEILETCSSCHAAYMPQ